MKAVVLHGGHGTRLRPLTHTGPKQLIKIAGKPISQWCLEDIRDSGIRDVGIVLGDLAPQRVVEYYGDGSWLGLRITYIYQGYPFGLAHAVYCARDFVGDEPFVVYLGDNLLLEGLSRFVRKFEDGDMDAYVLLVKVPDPQRFGVAKFDSDGRLVGLVEKPKVPPSPYALAGIYFFRPPHVFRAVEELRPSWRGELEITEALQRLIDWGLNVGYDIISGWWKDTGTPEDILEANRILLDTKVSRVIRGTVEDGARVEGRVFLAEGARVIRGSVVRGPAYIGPGTTIGPGTYVGPYTSIGGGCRLEGVEIENSIVLDEVVIEGVGQRLIDSILGSRAVITRRTDQPRGLRLIVGERAKVFI